VGRSQRARWRRSSRGGYRRAWKRVEERKLARRCWTRPLQRHVAGLGGPAAGKAGDGDAGGAADAVAAGDDVQTPRRASSGDGGGGGSWPTAAGSINHAEHEGGTGWAGGSRRGRSSSEEPSAAGWGQGGMEMARRQRRRSRRWSLGLSVSRRQAAKLVELAIAAPSPFWLPRLPPVRRRAPQGLLAGSVGVRPSTSTARGACGRRGGRSYGRCCLTTQMATAAVGAHEPQAGTSQPARNEPSSGRLKPRGGDDAVSQLCARATRPAEIGRDRDCDAAAACGRCRKGSGRGPSGDRWAPGRPPSDMRLHPIHPSTAAAGGDCVRPLAVLDLSGG
jgi:hypothetical protein